MRRVALTLVTALGLMACGHPDPVGQRAVSPEPIPVATPTASPSHQVINTHVASVETITAAALTPMPSPSGAAAAPGGPPLAAAATAPNLDTTLQKLFAAADTDHNGHLTQKEIAASAALAPFADELGWRLSQWRGWDYDAFSATMKPMMSEAWKTSAITPIDPTKTPVLLVQGYAEPSYYLMYGIYKHLQKEGYPVYGINLAPNIEATTTQAPKVQAKIQEILNQTGAKHINLVCHSFGGIISRYYIQNMGGDKVVDRLVTIATPHYGTHWCPFGPGAACDDMRINGPFLTALNQKTIWAPVRYSCIWTKTDEIVLPAESAELQGAKIYPPVPFTEHALILWSSKTYAYVDESLTEP